jgi:hypothetical protein
LAPGAAYISASQLAYIPITKSKKAALESGLLYRLAIMP